MIILTLFTFRFSKYYSASCDVYAQNGIKGGLTREINLNIINELNNEKTTNNQLVNIKYQSSGQISSIEMNSVQINLLANKLSDVVYDSIRTSNHDFGVPLGNALGSKLFSGKGPEIKIDIVPVGAVSYEIKSEMSSGGINQTLHRVYIEYTTEIECLAPFYKSKTTIENSVIISETLIVGKVPEVILPKI